MKDRECSDKKEGLDKMSQMEKENNQKVENGKKRNSKMDNIKVDFEKMTDTDKGQDFAKGNKKTKKKIHWITLNEKYMSVSRYVLFVLFAAIVAYMLVSHWNSTMGFVANFIKVLSPFIMGLLFAYFLLPLVMRIDGFIKKYITKGKGEKLTRVAAIFCSYLIVLGFIAIAFVFIIPQMGQSIQELTNKIPGMYQKITGEMTDLQKTYPALNIEFVDEQLKNVVPNLVDLGTNLVSNVIPMLYSVSVSIVKWAINIILGIVISIYMIYSRDKFRYQAKRVVYAIFPEEKGDVLCNTCSECNGIFSAFLISKAIDSLIIGCICCVAMSLLHLPYAVLLSVIVGITNMIPYFGPFIGAVPGVLIYLCTNWEYAIIFAIMILVLQQFDGVILGPRLLGQSTGLSPIWVIFAITVGGAYFGVIGMFIGVPVVAVIAYLCNKFISSRLDGKKVGALEEFDEEDKQF